MAIKPPQKGSTQWHPLPSAPEGYEEVEIGIKYVGAHEARDWMIRMQKINLEEKARKLKEGSEENSLDFITKLDELSKEVLAKCVSGAKKVEGMAEDDAQGALDLLEYLGDEVEAATFNLCQETQSLSLRQRFLSARTSGGG